MKSITFTCKVITPLFMGGADQQAELRTQSFKGLIRFWWRALGGSREDERKIFGWGGDDGNRSLLKIQIKEDFNYNIGKFNKNFSSDGRIIQCGLNYISFSLDQRFKKNDHKIQRENIKNDTKFTLKITFSPLITDEEIKKVLATLWAVFYLGNFGSRSRRGFGSIMLEKAEMNGINNNDLNFDINKDIKEWYSENINKIKGIFKDSKKIDDIISISKDFKIYKLNRNNLYNVKEWVNEVQKERKGRFLANKFSSTKIKNPEDLLDVLGFLLMAYRSYYNPDYTNAKNIINGGTVINKNIQRVIFGLPLNFFFSSIKKGGMVEAVLKEKNDNEKKLRRASPIIFKIIKIDENNYEGLIIYAKSKFLPDGSKIKLKNTELNLPNFTIIGNFFETLLKKKIIMEIYK